jgi:histidyl-tRNA synthetase|nr:ATP phosphoribosyltransferase regulatory subunit [Neorhizobium tomejilense]
MLRGTRIIDSDDAKKFVNTIASFRRVLDENGIEEVIFPSIWEAETFDAKLGQEKETQIWRFKDRKDRSCCLIPEVTALAQQTWREKWRFTKPDPFRLFYVQRCYRYERPQAGRYREFTQFGLEIMGSRPSDYAEEARSLLLACIGSVGLEYVFEPSVRRGISYYVSDGFEVLCPNLGAQKQVAGGGVYPEGVGWAIGVDRVVLALGNTLKD